MTVGGAAAAAELPLCPVCCETLGTWGGPATLPCGHNGCLECFQLVQQRNAQCPLCRATFGRELKLSCNHELEDLIRLATMLFVDESAQRDGWEAFPTTQITANSYAAELIRGNKKPALPVPGAAALGPTSHPVSGANPSVASSTAATAAACGQGGGGLVSGLGGLGSLALSGFGLSSLGFGGGGGNAGGGGNPNALEDLHDIMTSDPLGAAAQRSRRHSDGSSGGLIDPSDGGHDWGSLPSAPSLGAASTNTNTAGGGPSGWGDLNPQGSGGPGSTMSGRAGASSSWAGAGGSSSGSSTAASSAAVLSLEPPLWLPDSHASECLSCHLPFRPFTRLRHHCRLCGKIYCASCCHKRALLPPKYGVRTPQRVCELCACALAPHQQLLAGTLAPAAQPPVQDAPDAISLRAWLNSPWTSNLGEDIFKAANMLSSFVKAVHLRPESDVPTAVLQGAEGLAVLTVARLGAGWSLSFGTGLVVARTPTGWSAPCAISAAGVGWGLQAGAELADVLLVLRSREALAGLCGGLGAGVTVGGAAALALGPLGRHADAAVVVNAGGTGAAAYGYSCSKGAFVGLSVESSVLCVRTQVNLDFYGYPVTPRQLLLEAAVPPPPAAAMLYEGIKALLHRFECRRRLVHTRTSGSVSAPHQRPQQPHHHPQPLPHPHTHPQQHLPLQHQQLQNRPASPPPQQQQQLQPPSPQRPASHSAPPAGASAPPLSDYLPPPILSSKGAPEDDGSEVGGGGGGGLSLASFVAMARAVTEPAAPPRLAMVV